MPAHDLKLLLKAAQEAGEIAKGYTGQSARCWDKPDGAGPVTEADLAVNDVLQTTLRRARPDYGWLSEESEDEPDRLDADHVFIIDPIDGTRSFIEGSSAWAHSIAVARQGIITAAVIYLPRKDKLYAAAIGQGATLNGTPVRVSAQAGMDGATVLGTKPTYLPENWRIPVPAFARSYRPSLAYRLACVAEGRFDAMLTLRPTWEWDVAAGDLILREAGAQISDRRGTALQFNNAVPQVGGVVAAGPALHTALLGALA